MYSFLQLLLEMGRPQETLSLPKELAQMLKLILQSLKSKGRNLKENLISRLRMMDRF